MESYFKLTTEGVTLDGALPSGLSHIDVKVRVTVLDAATVDYLTSTVTQVTETKQAVTQTEDSVAEMHDEIETHASNVERAKNEILALSDFLSGIEQEIIRFRGYWNPSGGQPPYAPDATNNSVYQSSGTGTVNGIEYTEGSLIRYTGTDWVPYGIEAGAGSSDLSNVRITDPPFGSTTAGSLSWIDLAPVSRTVVNASEDGRTSVAHVEASGRVRIIGAEGVLQIPIAGAPIHFGLLMCYLKIKVGAQAPVYCFTPVRHTTTNNGNVTEILSANMIDPVTLTAEETEIDYHISGTLLHTYVNQTA